MSDLLLQLMSRSAMVQLKEGEALVSMLEAHAPPLLPDRCGSVEPLRRRFAKEGLAACWDGGDFIWKAAGRAGEGHVIKRVSDRDAYAYVVISADGRRVGPGTLIPLLEDLVRRFGAHYGFLHPFTAADSGRSGPYEPYDDGGRFFLMPAQKQLTPAALGPHRARHERQPACGVDPNEPINGVWLRGHDLFDGMPYTRYVAESHKHRPEHRYHSDAYYQAVRNALWRFIDTETDCLGRDDFRTALGALNQRLRDGNLMLAP